MLRNPTVNFKTITVLIAGLGAAVLFGALAGTFMFGPVTVGLMGAAGLAGVWWGLKSLIGQLAKPEDRAGLIIEADYTVISDETAGSMDPKLQHEDRSPGSADQLTVELEMVESSNAEPAGRF